MSDLAFAPWNWGIYGPVAAAPDLSQNAAMNYNNQNLVSSGGYAGAAMQGFNPATSPATNPATGMTIPGTGMVGGYPSFNEANSGNKGGTITLNPGDTVTDAGGDYTIPTSTNNPLATQQHQAGSWGDYASRFYSPMGEISPESLYAQFQAGVQMPTAGWQPSAPATQSTWQGSPSVSGSDPSTMHGLAPEQFAIGSWGDYAAKNYKPGMDADALYRAWQGSPSVSGSDPGTMYGLEPPTQQGSSPATGSDWWGPDSGGVGGAGTNIVPKNPAGQGLQPPAQSPGFPQPTPEDDGSLPPGSYDVTAPPSIRDNPLPPQGDGPGGTPTTTTTQQTWQGSPSVSGSDPGTMYGLTSETFNANTPGSWGEYAGQNYKPGMDADALYQRWLGNSSVSGSDPGTMDWALPQGPAKGYYEPTEGRTDRSPLYGTGTQGQVTGGGMGGAGVLTGAPLPRDKPYIPSDPSGLNVPPQQDPAYYRDLLGKEMLRREMLRTPPGFPGPQSGIGGDGTSYNPNQMDFTSTA